MVLPCVESTGNATCESLVVGEDENCQQGLIPFDLNWISKCEICQIQSGSILILGRDKQAPIRVVLGQVGNAKSLDTGNKMFVIGFLYTSMVDVMVDDAVVEEKGKGQVFAFNG